MTPEGQLPQPTEAKPQLMQRVLQPLKQGVDRVRRRKQTAESTPTGTTSQNTQNGIEGQPLKKNAERKVMSEHEAYIDYLTRSGKPIPQIAGLSYKDLTPADKEYINQTYKEYLIEKENEPIAGGKKYKYTPQYHRYPVVTILPNGEQIREEHKLIPKTYKEYLHETGRQYIIFYSGETLSQSEKDYITQTYREYLRWEHKEYSSSKEPPTWMTNSLLTQEAKEELNQWSARVDHNLREEQIENYLKYGNISTPIIVDGKIMTGYEYFLALWELHTRFEPIAKTRGVPVESLFPPAWQYKSIHEEQPLTDVQRKAQALKTVRTQQTELGREILTGQIDAIAESIQQKIWKDTSKSNPVSVIKPTGLLDVKIKKDGTVINHSRSGVSISFKQDMRTGSLVRRTEKGEAKHDKLQTVESTITFGYGFFGKGKQGDIIPEARGSVTDDEENFKALYIQRTYADVAFISSAYKYIQMKKKTEMYVFPLAYAEHKKEFVEYLYEISKLQSPDQVMKQNPGMPMYLDAA